MTKIRKLSSCLPVYFIGIFLASFLWDQPFLLAICFIFLSAFVLYFSRSKKEVGLFLISAILGSVGEIIAIYSGAWEYSRPFYLIPIWLPFAWGIAGLILKKTTDAIIG